MNPNEAPNRCRLVLIAPPKIEVSRFLGAFAGGDVASIMLPAWEMDEATFQHHAEAITPFAQEQGAAVMVAGDIRIAMRAHADGLHVEENRSTLEEIIEKHQSRLMIGAGGATTRDDALDLGEARPDYMFFGRFGYDNKPEAHPRNIKLGQWWAEMVQIPAIVLGGNTLDSIVDVAQTGAEFVALSAAIFEDGVDPADAVARANALLDTNAPAFEG